MNAENLERDFAALTKRRRDAFGKSAQGVENQYGQAYQALVKAGVRPQIRHKYRVSKG